MRRTRGAMGIQWILPEKPCQIGTLGKKLLFMRIDVRLPAVILPPAPLCSATVRDRKTMEIRCLVCLRDCLNLGAISGPIIMCFGQNRFSINRVCAMLNLGGLHHEYKLERTAA